MKVTGYTLAKLSGKIVAPVVLWQYTAVTLLRSCYRDHDTLVHLLKPAIIHSSFADGRLQRPLGKKA